MTVPAINSHPTRKTGARPPKRAKAIKFSSIIRPRTVDFVPFDADYLKPLAGHWQMLGNDRAGDCEPVRWANNRYHLTYSLTDTPHYPSQDDVWTLYKTQNPGFVPGSGPHGYGSADDQGMETQTLLEYLHRFGGPDGVKAIAFAEVEPTNHDDVAYAIDIFGGVWVDIIVLVGNQGQFERRLVWVDDGSAIDGGHAVYGGGVVVDPPTSDSAFVRIETWADETALSDNFWRGKAEGHALVQAVWAVIWPEHLGTRQFHQGIDRQALQAAYEATTHSQLVLPDPPTPTPTPGPPVPTPPAPTPDPGAAPFPGADPAVVPHVVASAARAHLSVSDWLNHHFVSYFGIAGTTTPGAVAGHEHEREAERDNRSGRFVGEDYASEHRDTTSTEHVGGEHDEPVHRDDASGRFVTPGYAKEHPDTTGEDHV